MMQRMPRDFRILINGRMIFVQSFGGRYQHATATTLRLIEGAGLDEKGKRPGDVVGCKVNGDSWFASHQTAKACMDELAVHFVGNVKTATKHFPKKEMWACLEGSNRGDHVVFRNVASNIHAVGWNNGHKKTFVCSAGSSNPSKEALYKRQRDDGTTFQRRVKCPEVIGTYHARKQPARGMNTTALGRAPSALSASGRRSCTRTECLLA